MAKTGTPSLTLPNAFLGEPARLVEARQGEARYVPRTLNETLASIFSTWNLLDAVMHEASPGNNYQTGYVREIQLRRMLDLVMRPTVRMYCEIGFNGGHSAAAMLLANPSLVVHTFDLMMWKYSERAVGLLRTQFGPRFTMHSGNSASTVPQWAAQNRGACDLLFVDGDHEKHGAMSDMVNMREAAASGAHAIADDINTSPGRALEDLAVQGVVRIEESYGPFEAPSPHNPCMRTTNRGPLCMPWGFAVYTYAEGGASTKGGGAKGHHGAGHMHRQRANETRVARLARAAVDFLPGVSR